MTDREQALSHLRKIVAALEIVAMDVEGLNHVVGKAQNRRPLGDGDETLVGSEWNMARDVAQGLRQAFHTAKRLAP